MVGATLPKPSAAGQGQALLCLLVWKPSGVRTATFTPTLSGLLIRGTRDLGLTQALVLGPMIPSFLELRAGIFLERLQGLCLPGLIGQ